MIRALLTAASGMKAQQKQVDTIANNIANVNTGGYKRSDLTFRSLLYQTYKEPGAPTAQSAMSPTGLQIGSGVEIAGSLRSFRQGELMPTDGDFHMGINGQGFFQVQLPSGEMHYTRDGHFQRDGNGDVVTSEGYKLQTMPTIGADVIEVSIAEDGTVTTRTSESDVGTVAGTLSLFRFANPEGLKAQGNNLYSETASSGTPGLQTPGQTGTGRVIHRHVERSNVEVVDELVGLIMAQRNYEVNSRAVQAADEMLQQTNQMIR
ncbi:MAG: flagellar basal-body rod protein FlgG [bacterium]|jgi:flagellar basal-body rod protein FlgG|nr:flagellar basal-body rod protein FlgG [Planctomycetota bacterium]HIL52458.1 flagellar basal-body rod protein FlgG [Planctomycetota bacterium]